MKKFALSIFLLIYASCGFASTYYVRIDGGTPTQCSGLSNVAYSGSIFNRACAWSHPMYVFPPNIDGGDPANKPLIKSGDTLIIGNGQYQMGLPFNAGAWGSCNVNWPYDCHTQPIPSGTAAAPTKIMGANYASCANGAGAPQLWGSGGTGSVLNLTGSSYVTLQCLEITDHSNCIQNQADASVKCVAGGTWGSVGITNTDGKADNIPSTNVVLQDVNIHGMAKYGVLAGNISGWTVNHVKINANGFGGWSTDLSPAYSISSGTNTFTNVEIAWNGCTENYPASTIWGCWGQQTGGYGDGFGSSSSSDKGTWLFQDVQVHDNTQDGLDFLHADPGAVITFDRVNAYRNAGNQLKGNGVVTIQNSVVNAYCSAFQGVGDMQGNNTGGGGTSGDICRALGDAVVVGMSSAHTVTLQYNTILSQGNCLITVPDSGTGDATSKLNVFDNVLVGLPVWIDGNQNPPPQSCLYYWTSTQVPTFTSNVIYNVKGTPGLDPKLTNETLAAFNATPLAGSPAIGKATGPTLAVDFNSTPRTSPADIGAIQSGAAVVTPPPVTPPPVTCPPQCIPKLTCTSNSQTVSTCSATCQ